MSAGYKEHDADPRLAPWVACYWTHTVAAELRGSHPVVPDGCIDLLFDSGTESLRVVGTMTRTLWAEDRGPRQFVGVRFNPGGAVPFLRERADRFTDDVAEVGDVLGAAGSGLKHELLDSGSEAERVRLVERFLLRRSRTDVAPVDSRIAWATSELRAAPRRRIDSLAHELGMSRQYVRRLFLEHTGLSPKAFARIARLERLLEAVRGGAGLAEAAVTSGYADQAHMHKELKDLVGVTPADYRRGRDRHGGSIPTRLAPDRRVS
jgi:AraC-like DNA-binding protein